MRIRVLYFTYPMAFNDFGGAEVQLIKTKEHLEKLSYAKGQRISIKLFDIFHDKLDDFDVLHNFQARIECLSLLRLASIKGLKIVLSPIYWTSSYTRFSPTGLARFYSNLKFYRMPTFKEVFPLKDILDLADIILPNSQRESFLLSTSFKVDHRKFFVVPNGVDRRFYDARPNIFVEKYGLKDFVLYVGRIDARKNVLSLLKVCKEIGVPTLIIGVYNPFEQGYVAKCKEILESSRNIRFIGFLPYGSEDLLSAYAAAKVFVLPSWFETPGLSALEAGLAGCNLVITNRGSTAEYFKDYALYVNPGSTEDIKEKILEAYERPKNNKLKEHILNNYTWEKTAERTLDAYNLALSKA